MKIRLDVDVKDVAKHHAVVEVPDDLGYAMCARYVSTQMFQGTPVTVALTKDHLALLRLNLREKWAPPATR